MMWDIEIRGLKCSRRFDYCLKTLDANEKVLVAGCSNGAILILDPLKLTT